VVSKDPPGYLRWVNWRPWVACSACGPGKNCASAQHKADGLTRSPQRDFIEAWLNGKESWLTGGGSLGKTEALAWIIASVVRGYVPGPYHRDMPKPAVVWYVAPDSIVAKGSVEDKLFYGKTTLGQAPFIDPEEVVQWATKVKGAQEPYVFDTGSEFLVRGTSGLARKLKAKGRRPSSEALSLTAARITLGVLDEPCPEAAYDEMQMRLSQGLPLIGAATFPPKSTAVGWWNRRVYRPFKEGRRTRLNVSEATTRDNPYISAENYERMREAYSHDKMLEEARLHGTIYALEGSSLFSEEAGEKMERTVMEPLSVATYE
jgi:hypothetical protein